MQIKKTIKPTDTLLVVDAMTGQEAAGLVKAFNDAVDITGAFSLLCSYVNLGLHHGKSLLQVENHNREDGGGLGMPHLRSVRKKKLSVCCAVLC